MTRQKSAAIYSSMKRLIPGGVNSPVRSFSSMDILPMVVKKGKGALITDADGYSYIDYCGSWGPLIHGHTHPLITKAAHDAIDLGSSFGITTEIEGEIAKEVQKLMPSMERMRFVSSGTEATMTAIRVARGYTGREMIIKFTGHYHGHADSLLVKAGSGVVGLNQTSSSLGIPNDFVKHTLCIPFNDVLALNEAFNEHGSKIAALILEPVPANMGVVPPLDGFLEEIRSLCTKNGSLLIFDEVITGFRLALGGAQELFNIKPDLTCIGKIIGGGFPAAAFGGREEIMNVLAPLGGVYQAGTLSGNPVAMSAGLASLKLLQAPHFYEELERKTNIITLPIQKAIKENNLNITLNQIGSLFTLFFGRRSVSNFEEALQADTQEYKKFFKTLFDQGIYAPPSAHEAWFVSAAHSDEQLKATASCILNAI